MTISTIYGRIRTAVQSQRPITGSYRFRHIGFSIVILGLSVSLSAAEPAKRMFNIEAKPAAQSLTDYAQQAHTQLGYDVDIVDDILTNAVVGEYESAEALELLLEGTGLAAEHGERGIFIRRVPKREVGGDIEERTPPVAETNSLQFAQTLAAEAQATVAQNQTSRTTETDSGEDEKKRPLEEIIVTGTNIRGIAPDSSPTRTYTREDIQISGAGTTQDFIQTLTENFGGGSNANIPARLGDQGAAFNAAPGGSFGSSVNLRGLGSGATLVVLNGHRLAPASTIGDFTDISMIPASAIERVETLTDGASSIYGSDAVAGVVNFILRDDIDGLETSLRYGTGTENGTPDQYRADIIGGKNWDSGHALVAYEFFNQEQLSVEDRSFAQQDVVPNYLLPSQKRHSILASAAQDVTPDLELFADFTYSDRKARQIRTQLFAPDVTNEFNASSESMAVAAGGGLNVWGNWVFDFSGTYSDLDTTTINRGSADRISVTDSSIGTADAILSGTLWRVPGGDIKLALGGHFRTESFFSNDFNNITGTETQRRDADRNVYAAFGEVFIPIIGNENSVAGIERLEVNASGRIDHFNDFGSTANPKVGALWSPVAGLNFRGSYSTSFKAPPLGRVGVNDLNASLLPTSLLNALFGFTPGDPSIADVVVLTQGGTDKNLDAETSRAFTAGLDFHQQWRTHSLEISATWFDIDFKDRIGTSPIPGNTIFFDAPNIAFNNPDAFPEGTVIFSPTQDQVNEITNSLDRPLSNPFGLDPLDVEIINRVLVARNLSRTVVRGLDFDLAYTYELTGGALHFGLDGTFLIDFQQQAASSTPLIERLNTLYSPVGLKLRGRAGYSDDNFSANVFVNFVDDYQTDNTATGLPLDSWTTVDVSFSYDTTESLGNSILNNSLFRLSVINLFDDNPPLAPINTSVAVDGYDPTNASPLGRFIAFEITKAF